MAVVVISPYAAVVIAAVVLAVIVLGGVAIWFRPRKPSKPTLNGWMPPRGGGYRPGLNNNPPPPSNPKPPPPPRRR